MRLFVATSRLRAAVFALALILLAGWPIVDGRAAPIFAVELDFGDTDVRSDAPLSRSSSFNSPIVSGNFYLRSAFASAERGALRASAHGTIFFPDMRAVGSASLLNNTDAIAAFVLDDVVITGPASTVTGALKLHMSGGVGATAFARNADGFGSEARSSGSVSVNARVAGIPFGGTQSRGATWDAGTGLGANSVFEDGIFSAFDGDEDIISPSMSLPVGVPFTVVLALSVSEQSEVSTGGFGGLPVERKAEGSGSFATTVSFPLLGPVFDLPEGYTVNSEAGLIVDNRWLGAPTPVAVPEPSTLTLLGAALLGLGLRRRGRARPTRV